MSVLRQIQSLSRTAALATLLMLAASLTHAASTDYLLKIEGIDGESTSSAAAGFDFKPFGDEPMAALLVPAVQKIREAAARPKLAEIACDGSVQPRLIVEVSAPGARMPFLRYELTDVVVTSYAMKGGDTGVMEEVAFSFARATWTDLASGESFSVDCSSGRCICSP